MQRVDEDWGDDEDNGDGDVLEGALANSHKAVSTSSTASSSDSHYLLSSSNAGTSPSAVFTFPDTQHICASL